MVQTLRQQVLIALRDKILRRELMPGERLIERELAAELSVSRTPIRECLLVLEMEGLAEISPGLGVVVRNITSRQVREALAVRAALDALAGREAAQNHTDEDLALIEVAFRVFDLAFRALDKDRITRADSQFHARIYDAAHNSVLTTVRTAFALYEGFYFHGDFYRYTPEAFARSRKRHHQMLEAIASRDPGAAERASVLHLEEAAELVRDEEENAGPKGVAPAAASGEAKAETHV